MMGITWENLSVDMGAQRGNTSDPHQYMVILCYTKDLFNFRDLNTHHCNKFFFKLTAPWRICMYVHPRVTIYLNKLFCQG